MNKPPASAIPMASSRPISVDDRSSRVDRLYREHRQFVYRLALRYAGGNRAWAEDVTQEVFLRLMDAVDELEHRDGLEGWFYRVTSNRCLNRLRRERFRNSGPVRWILGRRTCEPVDPEQRAAVRQELSQAWNVLHSLPAKEQVAFSMYYVDGKLQSEIAELLGHSKGYVCKLIKRAETRVREAGWEVERG